MADRIGALPRTRGPSAGAWLAAIALTVAWQAVATPPAAVAQPPVKEIQFEGRVVRAPASWPVYRLAAHPSMCVRLDRRAVYLGTPGAGQRCPAHVIGRRRAILVDPGARRRAARAAASSLPLAHISAASEFTGLGFDACTTPSRQAMASWLSSPYRAIGIYIGGVNRACSQPNLSSDWVSEETAAGWHLIPIYVGPQAPTSDCSSCATLSTGSATSQGSSAAEDAVDDARAVGIGPGSPIYFDMESYGRTSSASAATLTFLASWTSRLHVLGYLSGVYSSSASGIADLAGRYGTGYTEPDDIWIANWNGLRSTADPVVPASAWSPNARLKQYRGGHNETFSGVTINIDNDYVEGATAGGSPTSDDPKGRLEWAGSPRRGQVRIVGWAFDPNEPTAPLPIRAYVGGKRGRPGVVAYEAGPVAFQPRPQIAAAHELAGEAHGFDVSFPTVKNGRQPVCVYAVDVGPGSDKLLGCRTIGVPLAVSLSEIRTTRNAVRVNLRCEWPAGSRCPGQIRLRARVGKRVGGRRGGRRLVRRAIGERPFSLSGETSGSFRVALSRQGRLLTRGNPGIPAELVVAIPGGRAIRALKLGAK